MPEVETPLVLPTLEQIAKSLGAPDPDVPAVMNPPESQEAFRVMGAQIATERVLTDLRRILGQAFVFYRQATPAQKRLLRGFSEPMLAVAVDRAIALEALRRDFTSAGTADKSARVSSRAAAGVAFSAGLAVRDQAVTVFRTAVGTDVAARQRLTVAAGTAESDEALAAGLERLAGFGEGLLSDAKTAKRAAVAGVDAEYLGEIGAASVAVRSASADASGRLTAQLAGQGALDAPDGLCLDLLSHIVHAFAAARDRDGTIPRLVPQATRRLLSARRKKAKPQDEVVVAPQATA